MVLDTADLRNAFSSHLKVCAQLLSDGQDDGAPLRKLVVE